MSAQEINREIDRVACARGVICYPSPNTVKKLSGTWNEERESVLGKRDDSEQWAPVSDLMAALMLIFMFVSIIFIRTVVTEESVYKEECDKLHQELMTEFDGDFAAWDVELLEDLTIRFRSPEVLFGPAGLIYARASRIYLKISFPAI